MTFVREDRNLSVCLGCDGPVAEETFVFCSSCRLQHQVDDVMRSIERDLAHGTVGGHRAGAIFVACCVMLAAAFGIGFLFWRMN